MAFENFVFKHKKIIAEFSVPHDYFT